MRARGRKQGWASARNGVSVAIAGLAATLRVLADPRITAALGELADALDAHGTGEEFPGLSTGDDAQVLPTPAGSVEVTEEHRREAARRLRRRGVLR